LTCLNQARARNGDDHISSLKTDAVALHDLVIPAALAMQASIAKNNLASSPAAARYFPKPNSVSAA
jgi:hypothetical protein